MFLNILYKYHKRKNLKGKNNKIKKFGWGNVKRATLSKWGAAPSTRLKVAPLVLVIGLPILLLMWLYSCSCAGLNIPCI